MLDFLEQEQISKELLEGIREYRNAYPTPPELQNRIPKPRYHYYGKEVWEASIAALLCGENLLLAGSKATGKNVLAENLAQVFARPSWDVSFHVNMDAASLIGMRAAWRLRDLGRDQHGEKRGTGCAPRHAGLPPRY